MLTTPSRTRKIYTEVDLSEARRSLATIEGDDYLRANKPGQYRAALAGARALVETISRQLDRA